MSRHVAGPTRGTTTTPSSTRRSSTSSAGLRDYDHPAVKLDEGFYSAACDYWLGWYLQWPYFRGRVPRDVFRPYFELWARGCDVAFRGGSLCIARSAGPDPAADRRGV